MGQGFGFCCNAIRHLPLWRWWQLGNWADWRIAGIGAILHGAACAGLRSLMRRPPQPHALPSGHCPVSSCLFQSSCCCSSPSPTRHHYHTPCQLLFFEYFLIHPIASDCIVYLHHIAVVKTTLQTHPSAIHVDGCPSYYHYVMLVKMPYSTMYCT